MEDPAVMGHWAGGNGSLVFFASATLLSTPPRRSNGAASGGDVARQTYPRFDGHLEKDKEGNSTPTPISRSYEGTNCRGRV